MGRFRPRRVAIFHAPGFVEGAGRIFDFAGAGATAARMYPSTRDAAAHALYLDWQAVGHDLIDAADQVVANDDQGRQLESRSA